MEEVKKIVITLQGIVAFSSENQELYYIKMAISWITIKKQGEQVLVNYTIHLYLLIPIPPCCQIIWRGGNFSEIKLNEKLICALINNAIELNLLVLLQRGIILTQPYNISFQTNRTLHSIQIHTEHNTTKTYKFSWYI